MHIDPISHGLPLDVSQFAFHLFAPLDLTYEFALETGKNEKNVIMFPGDGVTSFIYIYIFFFF